MNQKLIDEGFRVASRMAADRAVEIDRAALMQAVMSVVGEANGQDQPEEIAEDALDLLGKTPGPSSSRRGRRPF
ncbi:MAG: hypothetical protein ACR652_20830 [Methylocystis sp.]|uniref:hypothetical protein n=1 Tax=Methylocystis sp. TaxID=1911079 RepID=UPI003DA36D1A